MVAVEADDVALQVAGVLLRTLGTEEAVTRDRQGLRTDQLAGVLGRRRGVDVDLVVGDRALHRLRQEGVVVPAQVEGRGGPDRVGFVQAVRVIVQVDVEERRLAAHEGFLGDVFGRGVEVDRVGDLEVGPDLITLRFRCRNAAVAGDFADRHAVAADVVRAVDADVADALTEVGFTGRAAVIDEGLARHDAVAVGGVGEVAVREAVLVRDVRVGQVAGTLQVGQGGLTPRQDVQAVQAVEDLGVQTTVIRIVRRVGVDGQTGRAATDPVDVHRVDVVDLLVLGVSIDVQAVVEEVLADQARDAAGSFTVIVDLAVVGVDLQAFEVLLEDEVQNA